MKFIQGCGIVLIGLMACGVMAEQKPGVVVEKVWQNSRLSGPGEGGITVWTSKPGAQVVWTPGFSGPLWTTVSFYKLVQGKNDDPQAQVQVIYAGQTNTVHVNCSEGESGWVELGTYSFNGTEDEQVVLTRTSMVGATRAAAVKFDLLSEGVGSQLVQSMTLGVQETPDLPDWVGKRPGIPGPPDHAEWELTFSDEFDGAQLNTNVWKSDASSPGHILSSRWPENVAVEEGLLRLLAKKEQRGGKEWTTGSISTQTFKQQYGYFECRMRISAAQGLNNSFWMMTKSNAPVWFEIDVAETRYPSLHTMNVHRWSGEHSSSGRGWVPPAKLSDDFHLYAMDWNEKELIWYFDGVEVRREPNTFCHDTAPVYLSLAVGNFAGKVTDAIDGTSQDVDWVRIYQIK